MMRALFLIGLALVASASAFVEVSTGYHEEVGIPTAEKIRLAEEKYLAEEALDNRVVGGVIAPANAHPYFVSNFFITLNRSTRLDKDITYVFKIAFCVVFFSRYFVSSPMINIAFVA